MLFRDKPLVIRFRSKKIYNFIAHLGLFLKFANSKKRSILNILQMKQGIHPENYRLVAFKDMSNEDVFLTKSTAVTKETIEVDGVEYPLVKLEISRSSHPYYTGKSKLIDTAGRIDKFKNKYSKFKKEAQAPVKEEE
jgi:large subunit ribosomal protein L31